MSLAERTGLGPHPGAKLPGDVVRVPDGRTGEVLSRIVPYGGDGTRYALDVFLFGIGKEHGTSTTCWEDEAELVEARHIRQISLRQGRKKRPSGLIQDLPPDLRTNAKKSKSLWLRSPPSSRCRPLRRCNG